MDRDKQREDALKGFTGWLVRRVMTDDGDMRSADGRTKLALLQGWVGITANAFIFVVKLALGLLLGSIALIADAFDSFSDVGASGLIVLGSRWARKPRDSQHPFGHGRAELIASLVTAIMLLVVGLGLARESIVRIWHPRDYFAPWWVIGVVALSIPIKEWLALFSSRLSRATDSSLIEAGYWHLRFDSIMAALVCGALMSARLGWVAVDGWVGLAIAALIVYAGVSLVKDRISPLVGEAPSPEEVQRIEQSARTVSGVKGVHDIIVHKYGDYHLISLHIEVDASMGVMDIHELSEDVESRVESATGGKAVVHVDPVDRTHPRYDRAETSVLDCQRRHPEITGFHDLRLTGDGEDLVLSVDIVVRPEVPEGEYRQIAKWVEAEVREAMHLNGGMKVSVEAPYCDTTENVKSEDSKSA